MLEPHVIQRPLRGHAPDAGARHDHESEIYDAMAEEILRTWDERRYSVDASTIPFVNREHVDYLSEAVRQLGPLAGRRILEVGAGSGSLAVWLAQQGAEVVGIDVSGGIVRVARRRAEVNGVTDRLSFVHSPIEAFDPLAAGLDHDRYDAIIGNNVVHHFDREAAMDRLAGLLAPGGVAVFCEPVLFVPEWMRRMRNSRVVLKRFPAHTHTPDERSLGAADFVIMRTRFRHVEWRPFQLLGRLQNFVELSDPTWNRLARIDRYVLARIGPARHLCRIAVITLGLPRVGALAAGRDAAALPDMMKEVLR